MHKRSLLAAVVFGILLLSTSNLSSAQIVIKGKRLNQTAPIATTAILTPANAGLFRLSVYATVTVADSNSQSEWSYNLQWTDDSGATMLNFPLFGSGNHAGSFGNFIGDWGDAIVIEVKAGTPINFSVSQSGPPDNSAYSLYYTLERLE